MNTTHDPVAPANLRVLTDIEFEVPVKGEVYLYLTDQYPCRVNFEFLRGESDLVIVVNVAESMAPILDMVAHKFSVIKRAYKSFIYLSMLT